MKSRHESPPVQVEIVNVPKGERDVNVGLEIPNFVGIILPTPFKSFVNSLSNIRKPLFYRFVFIHP